ncbi:lipoprotein-releasing ABC transporter permease subunit [Roseateles sp.]|uniref:lipoprotein-releasing ABC transporter permease subunit n=1 Tax=Roseateles sp. TaxID=1971397 RepID=UPI0025E2916F|nr:lipoprotein-releasing ABC transporter permease subunit [Roseateles sp.]MBV8036338.1 lipoprotein-releasing ABC transporter permease subunit [Roseateles sp.]
MPLPFELQVGWRYVRAGRGGRRNRFISFISGASMVGIALGVMALIVVLSVMNGFQKEVRDRMLNVIAHIELLDAGGQALPDWQATAAKARQNPEVVGAAPFVASQSLIARGEDMRGAIIRGISPAEEATVTGLGAQLKDGAFAQLQPGAWNIVLGGELARQLGVGIGDKITVVAPGGQVTPAGVVPRLKSFNVVGTFNSGHYQYDSGLALVHVDDAAKLFRTGGPSGVQLKLRDVNEARTVAADLSGRLGPDIRVSDWTRANAVWFDAVQIEKRMMSIVLTLIVAVAAFNLLSTLIMTVTDKQSDIAILRTLGASPRSIMGVFIVQGAVSGVIGTLAGVVAGLAIAFNIDVIVPAIEHLLNASFLPGSVYLISQMPSDPQAADILPIVGVSLALSLVFTLYPSWRASRVQPAEALRYE